MTICDGAGESDATMVVAGVPASRILTSSFGRAVLATRPNSADPEAPRVTTANKAEGATCCVIVTGGPVAGPPGGPPTLESPQPASSVGASAAPTIRPTRLMAFGTLSSFAWSRRPPPQDA